MLAKDCLQSLGEIDQKEPNVARQKTSLQLLWSQMQLSSIICKDSTTHSLPAKGDEEGLPTKQRESCTFGSMLVSAGKHTFYFEGECCPFPGCKFQ